MTNEIGKWLVIVGLLVTAAGLWLWLGPRIPWLGRLPGDVVIERPHFKLYFPVVTCVIVSLVLTLLAWWLRRH